MAKGATEISGANILELVTILEGLECRVYRAAEERLLGRIVELTSDLAAHIVVRESAEEQPTERDSNGNAESM